MFRHPDIHVCLSFINDMSRNRWYRDIIKDTVADKIVFEVGTGIGLLGAYCLENGAAHYYGIDIRSSRAKITKHILDDLGYHGRHTILTGDFLSLTEQDVPQSVDILLCEQIGYQFTNDFSIRKFWKHANQILKNPFKSIPEKWSIDVKIYEGQIDGVLEEYQPAVMLDDPSLPTGFYSAVEKLDFVKPSQIIKDIVCYSPANIDQPLSFDLDLTSYKSATVVITDRVSYQDSDCLAMSYIVDWPSPTSILIPKANGRVRLQWDAIGRDSIQHKKGHWQWELL